MKGLITCQDCQQEIPQEDAVQTVRAYAPVWVHNLRSECAAVAAEVDALKTRDEILNEANDLQRQADELYEQAKAMDVPFVNL